MIDKETSLEFVERMEKFNATLRPNADIDELLRLAKTAALIEEHGLMVSPPMQVRPQWFVGYDIGVSDRNKDLHSVVRAVADKIKEAS